MMFISSRTLPQEGVSLQSCHRFGSQFDGVGTLCLRRKLIQVVFGNREDILCLARVAAESKLSYQSNDGRDLTETILHPSLLIDPNWWLLSPGYPPFCSPLRRPA